VPNILSTMLAEIVSGMPPSPPVVPVAVNRAVWVLSAVGLPHTLKVWNVLGLKLKRECQAAICKIRMRLSPIWLHY